MRIRNIIMALCSAYTGLAFANPTGLPLLSIAPASSSVSVTSNGTADVAWTVTNNYTRPLTVNLQNCNYGGSIQGLAMTNGWACGPNSSNPGVSIAAGSNETVTMALTGSSLPLSIGQSEAVSPEFCVGGGQACMQPPSSDRLTVSLTAPQSAGLAYVIYGISPTAYLGSFGKTGTLSTSTTTYDAQNGIDTVSADGSIMYYTDLSHPPPVSTTTTVYSTGTSDLGATVGSVAITAGQVPASLSAASDGSGLWAIEPSSPTRGVYYFGLNASQQLEGTYAYQSTYSGGSSGPLLGDIAAAPNQDAYVSTLNGTTYGLDYAQYSADAISLTTVSSSFNDEINVLEYRKVDGQGYLYLLENPGTGASRPVYLQVCAVSASTLGACSSQTQVSTNSTPQSLAVSSDGTMVYAAYSKGGISGISAYSVSLSPSGSTIAAVGTHFSGSLTLLGIALDHGDDTLFMLQKGGTAPSTYASFPIESGGSLGSESAYTLPTGGVFTEFSPALMKDFAY